jgi:hypothetical protein
VREFLFEKLRWYGIDPGWFQSYFTYRCHFVKGNDGSQSQVQFTIRGTGQGTILGPILFSIYVNDLPSVIRFCLCILFADDTQLCIAGDPRRIDLLLEKVRSDLIAVMDWMKCNGMSLNVSKTQLIVIGNASNVARVGQVSIDVNGTVIVSTDCIKSLGLYKDSNLSWNQHINSLSRRYHFMAKSLYPLKPVLSSINMLRIIEACLISLTNYMVIIWGNASESNIRIIDRCIRSSARALLSKSKYDRILSDIYEQLHWLLPADSHIYFSLCLIYKILKRQCIPYFNGTLRPNLGLA